METWGTSMFLIIGAITFCLFLGVLIFQKRLAPKFDSTASAELKYYIRAIPIYIVGGFGIGTAILFFLLVDKENWNSAVFLCKLVGAIVAYLLSNHLYQGGPIAPTNYYMLSNNPTVARRQKEKNRRVSNLIEKYRSKRLIFGATILLILIDIIVGFPQYRLSGTLSLDVMAVYILMYTSGMVLLLSGFKYLSAWLNLRTVVAKNPKEIKALNESLKI